ncbi:MAG: cyclase family protein, partial [Bacteroidota bacterium]
MQLSATIDGHPYDLIDPPIDISIPLKFNGPQPNTYGVPKAEGAAYEQDGWVGDVRRGGNCNFETYTLTPHCNGTHTECIGHLTGDRVSLHKMLRDSFIPATLVTVNPQAARYSEDQYSPALNADDQVIDRKMLEEVFLYENTAFSRALVIRTAPNSEAKKSRDYMQMPPPFFTLEAARYLRQIGVDHLLVDLPSVDRLFDEGQLSVHHIFWDIPAGTHEATPESGR